MKIDFGIEADFLGKEIRLAPTNGANRQKLAELDQNEEMQKLRKITQEYEQKREKIMSDKRLNDDIKAEKLDELNQWYLKETDGYEQTLPEYRKAKLDVIVDEWLDGEPDDEFYSNEHFDDYALARLTEFFLTPKGATLNGKQ